MSETESGKELDLSVDTVDMTDEEIQPSAEESAESDGYAPPEGYDGEAVDVAEAMGLSDESDGKNQSVDADAGETGSGALADEYDYDTLVAEAAYLLDSGICGIDELDLPDAAISDGYSSEGLRGDAQAYLAEHDLMTANPGADDDDETIGITQDPFEIDWQKLWNECQIPDGKPQSTTQLQLIIEISEQTPSGSGIAEQIVEAAIEQGAVVRRGTAGFQPNWEAIQ